MVGFLLILVAVTCFTLAIFFYINTQKMIARTHSAAGIVVDLIKSSGVDPVFYPKVEFTPKSGDSIVFLSDVGSSPPAFKVGEEVTVLYNPTAPAEARVKSFFSLYLMPTILGSVGAVFFLVGVIFTLVG